jgi:tol-pal system protein YbgF
MKHRLGVAALAVAIAAGAATPFAAAADKETRQLMADIRILQEQSQQLQNLLNALNESIKAVNARIDEQTGASRKSFADQKVVIDALTNDLRVVREKLDDNNVRVGSISQELDALRQSIAAAGAVTRNSGPDADPNAAVPDPAAAAPSGAAAVGASPKKLWDGAQADYMGGQYDLAILGFDSYIKTFPQAQDADDAQYYIGMSYLQQGNNEKANDAYDVLIRNYPGSNMMPEAYYRKGTALKNMKRYDEARTAFEFLVKNFPDSQAAVLAQQSLQSLPAAPPATRR